MKYQRAKSIGASPLMPLAAAMLVPRSGRDVLAAPVEHFGQSTAESVARNENVNAMQEAPLGFALARDAVGGAHDGHLSAAGRN